MAEADSRAPQQSSPVDAAGDTLLGGPLPAAAGDCGSPCDRRPDRACYEELDHPADLFLEITGQDLPTLFENALFALYDQVAELEGFESGPRGGHHRTGAHRRATRSARPAVRGPLPVRDRAASWRSAPR